MTTQPNESKPNESKPHGPKSHELKQGAETQSSSTDTSDTTSDTKRIQLPPNLDPKDSRDTPKAEAGVERPE